MCIVYVASPVPHASIASKIAMMHHEKAERSTAWGLATAFAWDPGSLSSLCCAPTQARSTKGATWMEPVGPRQRASPSQLASPLAQLLPNCREVERWPFFCWLGAQSCSNTVIVAKHHCGKPPPQCPSCKVTNPGLWEELKKGLTLPNHTCMKARAWKVFKASCTKCGEKAKIEQQQWKKQTQNAAVGSWHT